MSTFRQVMNRVLVPLGEDRIPDSQTTLTGDYEILVGSLVNQIKEEIEDAHNWRTLWQTISVTVLAGASSANLTGTNERSRLVRWMHPANGQSVPLVFVVRANGDHVPLKEVSLQELIYRQSIDTTPAVEPTFFAVDDSDGLTPLVMRVHPPVTQDTTVEATLVVPQAELGDDQLGTVVKVPSRALVLGALWWATLERGEELGQNSMFTEDRFRTALDDAISRDLEEQGGLMMVPT